MLLGRLLEEALGFHGKVPALRVTGVSQDHRKVEPGHVFVARSGAKSDGHRWAAHAAERGAIAIVGSREGTLELHGVPYIFAVSPREAVARLAAAFHDRPSEKLTVVGVTGTDGKTSTSFLLEHVLSRTFITGLLSTAAARSRGRPVPLEGHFTTPEATEVQSYLAGFLADGCTHVVLESSSHGIASHRLDEVDYDLAVWTNLSPEHLDFHGSIEAYREAKVELVRRAGAAVLNADDPHFPTFAAAAQETITYGTGSEAQWRIGQVRDDPRGISFPLTVGDVTLEVALPMFGAYNAHNAAAALAAAAHLGVDPKDGTRVLADFPGVPGRMQVIQKYGPSVVIDFAHTGPALRKALQALRPRVNGRLLLVIGAAGERDHGKRAPLAQAAADQADLIFFTEEDHRSESLDEILAQLRDAALAAGALPEAVRLVPDRAQAIATAIAAASPDDLVLLAGKGHESTLERFDGAILWDEAAEVRKHLR